MAKVQFQFYPNPDNDFILQGGPPHFYSETPGYTRNSMLTNTSQNLSQHIYHRDEYEDKPQLRNSLRRVTRNVSRISNDLRDSLLLDKNNTRRTYTQAELNEVLREALNSNPPPKEVRARADWYTKPIHISEKVRVPMDNQDMLAARYFPVTLGESRSLEMLEDVRPGSLARSWSAPKPKRRSKSAKSSQQVAREETQRVEDMFFLTDQAPFIKMSGVSFISPYDDDLTRLRLEKLRLEELQYLELKRQAELERIRGPKPKWYELRGPEFHVEAGKNNELLRNSAQWDDLLRYRESLVHATKRLRSALEECEVPLPA